MTITEQPIVAPVPVTTHGNDGDHDRFTHIVRPAHVVPAAIAAGTPVTALCGKTWVPGRDPSRYQLCPTCEEINGRIVAGLSGAN